ncbi:MAG: glycoside hydrolase family 2 protein [Anaerolineae bacterium]
MANDLVNAPPDHRERLRARLSGIDGGVIAQFKQEVTVPASGAQRIGRIKLPLASIETDVFFLDLSLHALPPEEGLSAIARYVFTRTESLAPLLNVPPVRLKAAMRPVDDAPDDWKVIVTNAGEQAALWVWLEDARDAESAAEMGGYGYISYNHFCLLPGEALAIEVHWHAVPPESRALMVSGWNTNRVLVRESLKK